MDADAFRREQRANWDGVAAGWSRWWDVFEASAQELNEALVAAAAIAEGQRVLDVASGLGEPALTAARVVGPTGHVLATDLSPGMLAFAGERAAAGGVSWLETRVADAEQLALPPARLDAALCRFGLMLMRDPVAAARAVRAALRPGARFATAVWGEPDAVPFLSVPARALRAALDLPAPDPAEPGPFRLCAPGQLRDVLAAAGFVDIAESTRTVTFRFASSEAFTTFLADSSSTARKLVAERAPLDVARGIAAVRRAVLTNHAEPGGAIAFVNLVRCAVARAPAAIR